MEEPRNFTGVSRRRSTSWKVLMGDRVARSLITLGGLGTIVAVSLVCVFLVWVVVPLFLDPAVSPSPPLDLGGRRPGVRPLVSRVDEYRILGWTVLDDGSVDLFRVDTGALLRTVRPFGEVRPTAFAYAASEGRCVFGFADGTVRLARVRFSTEFLDSRALAGLGAGEVAEHDGGLAERTPEGQIRVQRLAVDAEAAVDLGNGRGVARIDVTLRGDDPRILACTVDGVLHLREVSRTKNLLTGKETFTLSGGDFDLAAAGGRGVPDWVLLSGIGTTAYAAWTDGTCLRLDTRKAESIELAERVDLRGGDPGTLTSLGFLIGKTTLVAGLSGGTVRAWFPVRPDGATTVDGSVLVNGHVLGAPGAAVTALAASERTRLLAAGFADGAVRLFHATSGRLIGEGRTAGAEPVEILSVAPKDDGIVAAAGGKLWRWDVSAPHPEIDAAAICRPVWYEGSVRPEHVWQSSSGTDDFEPKFGLWPLVFGTLKATLYSMVFAVPLALLAAIFTSEFLSPSARARVKPTIELMASLPSVVLGFLAALIFAPMIEGFVPALLVSFATVPFSALLGSYLWQMVPPPAAARFLAWRNLLIGLSIPAGFGLALLLGPVAERWFFEGDVKSWLDGQRGTGTGGWLLLVLPMTAAAAVVVNTRWVNPRLAAAAREWTRAREASVELLRFLASAAAVVGTALLLSGTLSSLGFDPRGSYVDTYVQRNALVVGIVMGFAVIPIIYTLSEDALASVPEHLRAASLAVGATRWQTAVSVILPTAMSGLFSATMIGLGRAVGETMVVLMAAGNTPVLEWNVFNGFRTLSANIAVELPEAVQGGTNYRMLFLAALTLFAITFVLNTVAESIRLRFRRRAFEL